MISNVLVTVRVLLPGVVPAVECKTTVGILIGLWRGETTPVVGLSVDVELETVGALVWDDGPMIAAPDGTSEHGQVLRGRIEDIEGEFVAVRVGDALLALEVQGEPPLDALGGPVSIKPTAFELWPTDI